MYRRAEHILLMEDFVVFRLTGTAQIDYSLATRTMAFDINALTWNRKILSAAGVDERLLSRPVPSGTAAGTLLPEGLKGRAFPPGYRWSVSARIRWQELSERECSTPGRLWNVRVRWSA